ncbi:hypothetical protein HPP92_018686, partial [Vanilla planifolia]
DHGSKGHRGIGFITFASADSVDTLMAETHELGGSTVIVDRATPKEEDVRYPSRMTQGGYGAYNAYISAATRYAALGAPTLYDHPSAYGRMFDGSRGMGKKIFVGRLPQEATVDDLRQYFGRFGRIVDVYVPKDPKRTGHRGFGFVTFADDGVADRVSRRTHEILGHEVAIDSATPLDDGGGVGGGVGGYMDASAAYGGGYGPLRTYGRLYGGLNFDDYGYGTGGSSRYSRMDWSSLLVEGGRENLEVTGPSLQPNTTFLKSGRRRAGDVREAGTGWWRGAGLQQEAPRDAGATA